MNSTQAEIFKRLEKIKSNRLTKKQELGAIEDAIQSEKQRFESEAREYIDSIYKVYDVIEEFYIQRDDIISQLRSKLGDIDMDKVYEMLNEMESLGQEYNIEFDFNIAEGLSSVESVYDAGYQIIDQLSGITTPGIG